MKRPVILQGDPYIRDYYRKDASTLLVETGGNTGNLAFRYAVASHLTAPTILPWDAPIEAIREAGDIIVLPLANQLGRHTDLSREAYKLARMDLPVIGIGLGAQAATFEENIALNSGTSAWIAALASHAPAAHPNIGVRGTYTADQIAKLGWPNAAAVIGCPSNFINLHDDVADAVAKGFDRKIRHVAVAAGIPYINALADTERSLAKIVTATSGAYIVQHDIEMIRLARGDYDALTPDLFQQCRNYILPTSTDDEFKAWLRRYAYAFFDVPAWMDFLRRFDFVIGTRFHGIMLAIQAGVPAGCIAHDSRTLEMCQTMRVPVCHYRDIGGNLNCSNMLDYFEFDAKQYRETRRMLCSNYVALLTAAELPFNNGLRRIAGLPK